MRAQDIEIQARQLHERMGERAIAAAARRAVTAEGKGEAEEAHMWRCVEERLKEMRGPRQG